MAMEVSVQLVVPEIGFGDREEEEIAPDPASMPSPMEIDEDDDDESSLNIPPYIHRNLKLRNGEIARLRRANVEKLLRQQKLILILDLDHTLLNTADLEEVSPEEAYVLDGSSDPERRDLHRLGKLGMVTKLRPFVRSFLREVSPLFELYIYTMGCREYALEMARILDPLGLYFGHGSRVISRGETARRGEKGLDIVLVDESMVVIIDDSGTVWRGCDRWNQIKVGRYEYFKESCPAGPKSLCEQRTDEGETMLSGILQVLRRVHSMFFADDSCDDPLWRDVRHIMQQIFWGSVRCAI